LVLALAMPARAELPPWGDWHPRILVDADILTTLPDSIAADPYKADTWDEIISAASIYSNLPPSNVLGSNYGLNTIPFLSLVAMLEDDPLATDCRDKVLETTDYLIVHEDVWGSGDDLSSALRLRTLLLSYDMAYMDADETARMTILQEIRRYLGVMSTDFDFTRGVYNPYCSNHSISIGSVLCLADLCLAGEWPDDPLLAWGRELGDSLIDKGMNDLLGTDGSYGEGGLYLAYIHRFLPAYWEAALRLESDTLWDEAKLAPILDWVAYQLLPRGGSYFLNRNDCSEFTRPLALHNTLWEWLTMRMPDPRFARWVQDRTSGENGFHYGSVSDLLSVIFYHRAGELLYPQTFLPPQRYFPVQGLYVYRKGWPGDPLEDSFHFTFQASRFMGGHWQEDVGQFTLQSFGHRFAMDHGPGTAAVETEGHNLPLVDGRGQHNAGEGIGTDGEMQALLTEGFCHALKADLVSAYTTHSPFNDPDWPLPGTDWSWGYDGGNPMQKAERWALLLPRPGAEQPHIYLLDDMRKEESKSFIHEWRLHFDEDVALFNSDDYFRLTGVDGRLETRLLAPPAGEMSWALSSFDNEGPDDESQVLSVFHETEDARFLWQLLPLGAGEAEPPLQVERFNDGLHATVGSAPDLLRELFVAWQPIFLAPDIQMAGRFALLEQEGGEQRSALIAGTEFWYQGQLYFGLEPLGSASVAQDTVLLSNRNLAFEIYAPGAVAVIADGEPVPYEVNGDYVYSGIWTGAPDWPASAGEPAAWSLRAERSVVIGTPFRLTIDGPGSPDAALDLFDVRGRRLLTLHRGPLPAGSHELTWRGRDRAGRRLPAGVYLARLSADGQAISAKLLLLH